MNLQSIIQGIAISDRRGRFEAEVTGIVADSRAVQPGHVFVAVRGLERDGHDYLPQAVERGACAVVVERWDRDLDDSLAQRVDVVVVPDTRRALGLLSANFYDHPSRKLNVVGVTGTNGKTTVSYILEAIILAAGRSVGVVGTVEARFGENVIEVGHTTPGADVLHGILARMAAADVGHAVLEVSSHALDQQRTSGIHFKVGCFTNLSQDHLDYHKTMDTYFEAKARLFTEGLARSKADGRTAVINVDDPRGRSLLERWDGERIRVSIDPASDAEVVVTEATYRLDGTDASLRTPHGTWSIRTALVGPHNLSNVAVAIGAAIALGFSKQPITLGLEALERVPGRLERVPDDGRTVFVDYAHTPDALGQVLEALRPHAKGKLVVVFGAGGDRDEGKRAGMGRAVGERADRVFLTSDNPRSEDPAAIADAVAAGLIEVGKAPGEGATVIELDRQAAIRAAVEGLEEGDVLLIAGKGHESEQVVGEVRYRFDDRDVARRALAKEPAVELETIEEEVDPEEVLESVDAPTRAVTETVAVEDVLNEAPEGPIPSEEIETIPDEEVETLSEETDTLGDEDPTVETEAPVPSEEAEAAERGEAAVGAEDVEDSEDSGRAGDVEEGEGTEAGDGADGDGAAGEEAFDGSDAPESVPDEAGDGEDHP